MATTPDSERLKALNLELDVLIDRYQQLAAESRDHDVIFLQASHYRRLLADNAALRVHIETLLNQSRLAPAQDSRAAILLQSVVVAWHASDSVRDEELAAVIARIHKYLMGVEHDAPKE